MQIDSKLRALADPTRREILRLARQERPAGEICRAFGMSRPSVSRHLGVLLKAGLLEVRPQGTARYYRTSEAAVRELAGWFDAFWDDGLPRLKALAEREERGK